MMRASAESIAQSLAKYGEVEAARWVLTSSDDELIRVCSVTSWLLFHGPTTAGGSTPRGTGAEV